MATTTVYTKPELVRMSATVNALGASGTVSLGVLPAGTLIVDAWINCEALTTNNALDVGDGNTADLFFDGVNPSAGAVTEGGHDDLIKGGYMLSEDTNVVLTNVGSAATPSSDKQVAVYFQTYRNYDGDATGLMIA